jgi:hypothetical protein
MTDFTQCPTCLLPLELYVDVRSPRTAAYYVCTVGHRFRVVEKLEAV